MTQSTAAINKSDRVSLLPTIFFLILFCPHAVNGATSDTPFAPGEKLTFQLSWSFIPAGEAVLEVKPTKTINGIQAYHFVLTAKSNSFVDVFYKVRDRIDAYADLNMTRSILYKKQQQEGRTHRDIVVNFDWGRHTVQYSNFKKKEKIVSVLPGSFDPLSVFYFSRIQTLRVGETVTSPVTDGKKCVIGNARVIKKEKLSLPSGTHEAYLLEPELKHIGGVFEKSKNAKIQLWISADRRRLPLKIKSEVVVGSFVGELISVEGAVNP